MSFWVYRKDANGRLKITSISIPILNFMLLFGLLMGIAYQTYFQATSGNTPTWPLCLTASGFLLFTISKITQFSKGIWVSWGTQGLASPSRFLYVTGYLLMGIGVLFMLLILRALV